MSIQGLVDINDFNDPRAAEADDDAPKQVTTFVSR